MSVTATIETVKVTAQVSGDDITAEITNTPITTEIGSLVYIDGDVNVYQYTAGEALSALRAVYADGSVYYASSDDLSTLNVVGVTIAAVSNGGTASVQNYGKLSDNSWSWTPGPVYVGLNGQLTQTAPTTGYIMEIARAISATDIIINIQLPILRA